MASRLEYRTNNAYDTILLVDLESGLVRSRWDATTKAGMGSATKATEDFLDSSQAVSDWDDQHMIDDEIPATEFGELLGWRQDGDGVQLTDEMVEIGELLLKARDN